MSKSQLVKVHIPQQPTIDGVNDFHYLSFEEAVTHPFTAEHQPPLQNGRRTNNKAMGGVARHGREITRSSESKQNKIL